VLKFFPFGERFEAGMGGRTLQPDEPLIDVDAAAYRDEIAMKRELLTNAHADYFQSSKEAGSAEWEVVELVLQDLARHHPDSFGLERHAERLHWHNRVLGERSSFVIGDAGSLAVSPLDWVGRQVQEDLVLVRADHAGVCVAGQLCFPNGWDIRSRFGQSFMAVHQPTPESTMSSVHAAARLLRALKPGKTFWRTSWNFKLTRQLDLSTQHKPAYKRDFAERAPKLTQTDVGEQVFVRVERQTFTRLTRSPYMLFGIHTYNSPLADEARDLERARAMLAVVQGAPDDVKTYKAIFPIEHALLPYLQRAAGA
jgi:dimethylamine monooxygenase subunit A